MQMNEAGAVHLAAVVIALAVRDWRVHVRRQVRPAAWYADVLRRNGFRTPRDELADFFRSPGFGVLAAGLGLDESAVRERLGVAG